MTALSTQSKKMEEFLKETPCWLLLSNKEEAATIHASWSVEAASTFLKGSDFLSAPVVDEEKKVLGFVDVLDLILFSCGIADIFMKDDQTVAKMGSFEAKFKTSLVKDVIGVNAINTVWRLEPESSLFELAEALSKETKRVLVGKFIVTQTDLVRFLIASFWYGQISLPSPLNISALDLANSKIVSIRTSEKALHGFALMSATHLSCVAVVDAVGTLVGNLSASDIRGITSDTYSELLLPVMTFLSKSHTLRHQPRFVQHLVTVKATATLEEILHLFSCSRLHRIYVVDDNGKALGLITLSDLIRSFYQCPSLNSTL